MPEATDAQVAQAWAEGLFNGTKANVLRVEQTAAAQTATNGVAEIGLA